MNAQTLNLIPAYPELFLLGSALLILLVDLWVPADKRHYAYLWSLIAIGGAGVLSLLMLIAGETHYVLSNMFIGDPVAYLLKVCGCIAVILTLIYSRTYATDRELMRGELPVLAMFALLGQMIMMSANHFLVLYLGLELFSLSLYTLVALRRDSAIATEAAMKYFVLGALASGFLLYGISMIYGATGTLDLGGVAQVAASGKSNLKVLIFGLVFLVVGIGFKLNAVPFHMWAPDVYEGSPTAVTLMIAGAPKFAAFAMLVRILIEGLLPLAADWQQMLGVLAVLSIALGNLAAIAQTNLKRMLAYSAIAQIGFMLLGFMSGYIPGQPSTMIAAYSASMFYTIVYVFTTLGTFGVIMLLARAGFECDQLTDLRGLNRRAPWVAFVLLLLMFSFAGLPPAVGFYAKFAVLQALINSGHLGTAIFAVIFSLIGAFYYLRIIKLMYFDEPVDAAPIIGTQSARVLLGLNGAFILFFGVFGNLLMAWCFNAMRLTMTS